LPEVIQIILSTEAMSIRELAKVNKNSFFLFIWMGTVPFVASSTLAIMMIKNESFFLKLSLGEWSVFYGLTALTMAFALTPTTFIALISGYFLGWQSVPGVFLSYLTASWIGYQLSGFFDKGKFLASIKSYPKASGFIKGLQSKQFGIIILSRISPILPFAIMNIVLPMVGVTLKKFLFAGFLGMLPRTLLMIWIGSKIADIRYLLEESKEDTFSNITLGVLIIISISGLFMYIKKIISENLNSQ
jgi:uncharacterized membrane protein YdjX (TVP38/TMEM64 family)